MAQFPLSSSDESHEDGGSASGERAADPTHDSDAAPASSGAEEPSQEFPDADGEANGDETRERTRRRLLKPIGGLYGLAQALTGTERAARRLVETTYQRAADVLARSEEPFAHSDEEARAWIFELLVTTAREAPGEGDRFSAEETGAQEAPDEANDRHFRRRAQERFLRRTLPSAFASLAPAQRLLLTLCDVERLDAAGAANVAGCSESDARERSARARSDLRDALRQMAPRPERSFLEDDVLPDARLAGALRRMAKRDLTAPPPALRPAARHALTHPRQAPAAPSDEDRDTAPDRPTRSPTSSEASGENSVARSSRRLPRLLAALLLIAVAGGLGYLATAVLDGSGTTDLATLSAERASEVNVRLRTERAASAEQFVRDELDRRLRVPHIEGAQLRGVGLAEVAGEERVPVFLFRDAASGRPVAAYAYDYALLDRAGERLRLSDELRQTLQKEGRVATQDIGSRRVLLWRHRDDIFAAVTDRADSLKQRIAF